MSASKGESEQSTGVWKGQKPFLRDLYQQGQQTLPGAIDLNEQLMGSILPAYQNILSGGPNPYLQQMGQAGLDQLQQNFGQTQANIRGNAAQTMNLGSSRQGVAEGLAAQQMTTESSNFLNQLYGGQYQADMNRQLGAIGLGQQLAQQPYAPLAGYSNIIGQPVTVGSGSSKSKAAGYTPTPPKGR